MNQTVLHDETRPRYRPSGKLDPARCVGALAILAVTSATLAVLYVMLLWYGFHSPLITLIMPVLCVAATSAYAVRYGKIRQPLLAAALAAACGAGGYLATFHLDQCLRWHAPWTAIDRLPSFIAFRMETDGWFFHQKLWVIWPLPANPNFQPQVGLAQIEPLSLHWLALLAETAIFIGVPGAAAWLAATAPFSEKCRRWMRSETLILHPDTQASFQQALTEQQIEQWVDSEPPRVPQQLPHWQLTVWYATSEVGQEPDPDVFVQLDRTTYVRLLPAEAAALVTLLPGLLSMAGQAREQLAAEADRVRTDDSARIWPVPASQAGGLREAGDWLRVQSWATFWYIGMPFLILVLTLGTLALVGWLIDLGVLPHWTLASGLLGVAAFLLYLRYIFHPRHDAAGTYRHRFESRLLRRAIAKRDGPLVSPDDVAAAYALAAPRRLWNAAAGNRFGEANHGLVCVDRRQRAILFEGNYERYRIPAEAILDCTLETPPTQTVVVTDPWAVVVTARLGSGTWEFPFFPLAGIQGNNNWERAGNLIDQIGQMCGRTFGEPITPPPEPQAPVARY